MLDARQGDYSKALWALVVLDEWVRRERIDSELDRDHLVEASKQ
jgi:hypothetical protein